MNFHSNNITVCKLILDVSSEITLDNDGNALPSDGVFCSFSALLMPVCESVDYKAVIVWAFFLRAQMQSTAANVTSK